MSEPSSSVVVARTHEEASRHLAGWARLYAERLESNLFLRPEFLLPLLEHDADERPFCLLFVLDDAGRTIGLAVLDDGEGEGSPFARTVSTWEHPLLFDATPMLHRRHADEAAAVLWSWLTDFQRPWSFVRWARVRLESAAWTALAGAIDGAGSRWWARRVYRRPLLEVPRDHEAWLASLSRSRRKSVRRIERKLAAAGRPELRVQENDLHEVRERFLEMEAAGWKGQEGTALRCNPRQERFFRSASDSLARAGAARFLELTLDGRSIAITANFVDGDTLYAYKTAYDPSAAELSPGVAIESALVRHLAKSGAACRIDSCAEDDSHLAGLWRQRATIGELVCSTGSISALSVGAAPRVRRSRRVAREWWRGLRRAAG